MSEYNFSNPAAHKSRASLILWAWSLGLLLLWSSPAGAEPILLTTGSAPVSVSTPHAKKLAPQSVLDTLAQQDVVYLGETHDREADHRAQLDILQALQKRSSGSRKQAIALEMFQRPYQVALDRYLAGGISEPDLQRLSEYEKRWGYPWDYYAPILRFAKEQSLPLIALNTPSEVTRKVARSGLQSLTPAERQYIPPLSEIRTESNAYRERMRQIYEEIHHGKTNSRQFETFFQAQVLWDETMADRISHFLNDNPTVQIIVLVGQGHLVYGDGIPNRVARRRKDLKQSVVLINPPEDLQSETNPPAADYFWNQP
ncbi:MAG: ChaN family lipoprotein [Myxacorys californica WJT36-NPBG1]|jgi:uncharacterized iron-regulated protein|nr:ChaN family lipoprotein [Myxacorys californica WJT36-NPBG1]